MEKEHCDCKEAALWANVSVRGDTISLHDHVVERFVLGEDVILHFDQGFDVTWDNPLNSTGRHRMTGAAVVILKGGQFIEGWHNKDCTCNGAPMTPVAVTAEELLEMGLECHEFDWREETGQVTFYGMGDTSNFCQLTFSCQGMLFCWNEFVADAWFQDWGKR